MIQTEKIDTKAQIRFAYNKCSESASVPSAFGPFAYSTTSCQSSHPEKPIALNFQHCELDCLKCQTWGGLVLARSLVNHVLGCLFVQDRFWSLGFQLQSRCGRRTEAPVPARLSLQMVPISAQRARKRRVLTAPTQVGSSTKSTALLCMRGVRTQKWKQ